MNTRWCPGSRSAGVGGRVQVIPTPARERGADYRGVMASESPVDSAEAETAPAPLTFSDLGLDDAVLKALKDVGYETPSAIQAATIPPLLAGRDVVGLAQTGTGKTAAFALPILSRLDLSQKTPQALVLAPTRELALQVCEAFEKYAAHLQGRPRAARLRRPGLRRPAVRAPPRRRTSSSARPVASWTTSTRAPSTSPS